MTAPPQQGHLAPETQTGIPWHRATLQSLPSCVLTALSS